MAAVRRSWGEAMLRLALVVCVMLLPMPVNSARSADAAERVEAENAAAGEQAKTAPEVVGETAAEAGSGGPRANPPIALRDPATGELVAVEEVDPQNLVKLPPGDLRGTVVEADGITPHSKVRLALIDAHTGRELISTATDKNGKFALEDVPEGLYLLLLGNPGIVAVLMVTKAAEPGLLNIVLPGSSSSPFPHWAPDWMHEYPVLATVVVVTAGTVLVVAPIVYFATRGPRRRISPITP